MRQSMSLALSLFAMSACEQSYEPDVPMMTTTEMNTSLDRVEQTLSQDHPKALSGLPSGVKAAFAQARAEVQSPKSVDEFSFVLSAAMATLGDSHTSLAVQADRQTDFGIVDLPLVWLKEGLVVKKDLGPLRKGDLIVSIGQRVPSVLLADLRRVIPSENDDFVRARAAELLVRSDYLRYLGVLGHGVVSVSVERNGVQLDLRLSLRPAPQVVESPVPFVRYEIDLAHSLGVLSLDACTHNDLFEQTLQQFMTEVARNRIQKIAIDLRQNRGGDATVALSFLRYIPKMYSAFSVELRSSADLLKQNPAFASDAYVQALAAFGVDAKLPSYTIPAPAIAALLSSSLPMVDPSLLYSGKLYVLTGPQTWSSANLFTLLVKDNQLGQQVGESIGNEANFYGQQLSFDLSGTHFLFHSASSRNIRPNPKLPNDRAVVPDVEVPLLRSDVLRDRDPVRAYIESL